MIRIALATLLWLFAALSPALADCHGTNLLARLSPDARAALVDGAPFARGNLWQATKGDSTITLIGTYHLDDPRFAPLMPRLSALVRGADLLLVEARPEDEARLKAEMARHPEKTLIVDGPLLNQTLPAADWQALAAAMAARGIPAAAAARLRPWFVSLLLSLPPCAMGQLQAAGKADGGGLDKKLVAIATGAGVPMRALEPWDTTLAIFDALSAGEQTAMIHGALAVEDRSGDLFTTLADAYFTGDAWLAWRFARARALAGPDRATDAQAFALMERTLRTGRNRAWLPVLTTAAAGHHVVAAFGAAHLGGPEGVLNLLHQAGFTLSRLPGWPPAPPG